MARNGIEPCRKAEAEGTECLCGLIPDVLDVVAEDEPRYWVRCRLCTGYSDHQRFRIVRFGEPWGIEVCGICQIVCDEL